MPLPVITKVRYGNTLYQLSAQGLQDVLAQCAGYANNANEAALEVADFISGTAYQQLVTSAQTAAVQAILNKASDYADDAANSALNAEFAKEQAAASAQLAAERVAINDKFVGEIHVSAFTPDILYKVNDFCRFETNFYRCVTQHLASTFVPEYWQETSLFEEILRLLGSNVQAETIVVSANMLHNQSVDWTTVTATLTNITTQTTATRNLDANGQCQFVVAFGEQYTISLSSISGYITPNPKGNTASLIMRGLSYTYVAGSDATKVVIVDQTSSNPSVDNSIGRMSVIENLLNGQSQTTGIDAGSYVIDEVHKRYAKLSSINHAYFADGTEIPATFWTASTHNVNSFRYIPRTYYQYLYNSATSEQINLSGIELYSGQKYLEDSWIGTYLAYKDGNSKLRSIPGVEPTRTQTMTVFWQQAQQTGGDYGLYNVYDWTKLNLLHMAYYGTRNSDLTMGEGLCNAGSGYYGVKTGVTLGLGDKTGSAKYSSTAYFQNKLFGIEALGGQCWQFCPNVSFNSTKVGYYSGNMVAEYANDVAEFTRPLPANSGTHVKKFMLGNQVNDGMICLLPTEANGSSATYWCDGGWWQSSGQLFIVGGSAANGSIAGLSATFSHSVFSLSYANFGARLAFKGNIASYTLVNGAYLVAHIDD